MRIVWPKLNRSRNPVRAWCYIGEKPTPQMDVRPPHRKRLQHEMPDNIRGSEELNPVNGTGRIWDKNCRGAFATVSVHALESGHPYLDIGRNRKRNSELLPRRSSKERLGLGSGVIRNHRFHECECRQQSHISRG